MVVVAAIQDMVDMAVETVEDLEEQVLIRLQVRVQALSEVVAAVGVDMVDLEIAEDSEEAALETVDMAVP